MSTCHRNGIALRAIYKPDKDMSVMSGIFSKNCGEKNWKKHQTESLKSNCQVKVTMIGLDGPIWRQPPIDFVRILFIPKQQIGSPLPHLTVASLFHLEQQQAAYSKLFPQFSIVHSRASCSFTVNQDQGNPQAAEAKQHPDSSGANWVYACEGSLVYTIHYRR